MNEDESRWIIVYIDPKGRLKTVSHRDVEYLPEAILDLHREQGVIRFLALHGRELEDLSTYFLHVSRSTSTVARLQDLMQLESKRDAISDVPDEDLPGANEKEPPEPETEEEPEEEPLREVDSIFGTGVSVP